LLRGGRFLSALLFLRFFELCRNGRIHCVDLHGYGDTHYADVQSNLHLNRSRQRNVLESFREESRGFDLDAVLPRRNAVEPVHAVRARQPALLGVRRFTHDANARTGNPGATRIDNLYSYTFGAA
jgi:hypothetical protein